MNPVISVILPVLNGERFVGESIESILSQTLGDFELIVVDDGSDDASPAIADGYARQDARVKVLRLKRDPNVCSGARADNHGKLVATGEYIARMDADDIALPNRLMVQLETLRRRDLDVCGSHGLFFGHKEGLFWFPEYAEAIRHELLFRFAMPHSGLFARARARHDFPLDESVAADDYDWYTRTIFHLRFGNCPEPLIKVRIHDSQSSSTIGKRMAQDWTRFRFRYFFRLFPEATLADFRALNAVALNAALNDAAALDLAGRWLLRLAAPPDPMLRARMAERWDATCLRARVDPEQLDKVWDTYAKCIARGGP